MLLLSQRLLLPMRAGGDSGGSCWDGELRDLALIYVTQRWRVFIGEAGNHDNDLTLMKWFEQSER